MKPINRNRANLLLLFTRDPIANAFYTELEYYMSEDERLLGIVMLDNFDNTYHGLLLERKTDGKFGMVRYRQDLPTIFEAQQSLEKLMEGYEYTYNPEDIKISDFFKPATDKEQEHPSYVVVRDHPNYKAARRAIEEVSFHFEDKDGNYIEQFQSINGFDARVWELYLRCYLREERFDFVPGYNVPDFIVSKGTEKVGIEAVIVAKDENRPQINPLDMEAIKEKLENDIPLMFGSPLYSKLKHQYKKQSYWELPQMKDVPLVYAIADFHDIMSMTWTFPAIVSVLYGLNQTINLDENKDTRLKTINGIHFFKENGQTITPLFLTTEYENISAIMFSPCGTISKFNRMGTQAGYGDSENNTLVQVKFCYNQLENALFPNLKIEPVTEQSEETWADGIQIFHNPLAKIKLDPSLFPTAGHHFYKEGMLYSQQPENHIMSSTTFNVKGKVQLPIMRLSPKNVFVDIERQWNM